ncbi:MAG: hypothetical protein FWG92_06145 [Leptospirales bacterium]|nr:hypothetical protein [Leptospirales bacterium]
MNLKILQNFALALLFILIADLTACCSGGFVHNLADIVEEEIEHYGEISGRVDFAGIELQRQSRSFLSEKETRNILLLFIDKLDEQLRKKIHVTRSNDFYGKMLITLPYNWKRGDHKQIMSSFHHPVSDEPSCSNCMNYVSFICKKTPNFLDRIAFYKYMANSIRGS